MAFQWVFDAIGTKWVIDIYKNLREDEEVFILSKIKDRIDEFDKVYSRFREDSLVTLMSQNEGIYTLPQDGLILMSLYKHFYDITNGLVTPLIGQALVDAGYDATYSLVQKKELTIPPTWETSLIYEHPLLTIKQPVLLDFGAAGKGYLIDLVGELLEENNIFSYCIDAGGDIRHRTMSLENNSPLKIGLENPFNVKEVIGVVELSNASIAASAGNRRKWGTFHHIIHPETLKSPDEIVATWVIATTTILADALATSLFFVTPLTLRNHYSFEYLLIKKDSSIEKSDGFNADVFS